MHLFLSAPGCGYDALSSCLVLQWETVSQITPFLPTLLLFKAFHHSNRNEVGTGRICAQSRSYKINVKMPERDRKRERAIEILKSL